MNLCRSTFQTYGFRLFKSFRNLLKRGSNLDYFLYWLWIWTRICKINRESSWICTLGFRFQVFWTSFNLFQLNESQGLLIHWIHRLFFVYGPLMKIWGETKRSFRSYLDFLVEIRTQILEKAFEFSDASCRSRIHFVLSSSLRAIQTSWSCLNSSL